MINVYEILARVREKKPLVHHITNWVTIYDCANIVKAVGAAPVMAHAPEEVEQKKSKVKRMNWHVILKLQRRI